MEIADPIQRAGMRLLSAAAVPIQTEIRRYLAKKTAEDRLWAVIVIQSYMRRWRAEVQMYRYLYFATKIQSVFRGWLVRDTMKHKHYCATQIQRICRGYLATMKVYEALYNITVVQSIVRRNVAIKEAEIRYRSIITIQSAYRGYAVRRDLEDQHIAATIIQANWKRFITQLNYQFDVVDIIIVQSIARKRACQKRYAAILHERHTKAAIVIQKYWRSYDCTMNYLHSIADILIVQSVVRRWIAMRFVPKYREQRNNAMATRIQTVTRAWVARRKLKKHKAAVVIQKSFRGFKQYIDYIFTIADIVLVQKTARGWLARRRFEEMKIKHREDQLYNAATTIQKVWRGYHAQMNMLFTLVHIIIAQSVVRRHLAILKFKPMLAQERAAVTIQCATRVMIAKRKYNELRAARKIQAAARGWFAYSAYRDYIAARKIQSWYRCQATRRGYLYYISARVIQTVWRGYDARKLAEEERWVREYTATMIQKNWRMWSQRAKYKKEVTERNAATKIQTQWRCFWEYSHFVILRYELIRIQAAVRGYQTRKRLKMEHENATVIQTAARVMLAKRFCHMERLFSAIIYSAQMSLVQKNSAKKIQTCFRSMHYSLAEKKAALVIERFFIWVRSEVEKEIQRREKMKMLKRKKKRSKKAKLNEKLNESRQQDDFLENVFEETLESASRAGTISGVDKEKNHLRDKNENERVVRASTPVMPKANVKQLKVRDSSPTKSRASRTPTASLTQRIPYNSSAKSRVSSSRSVNGVYDPAMGALDFDDNLSVSDVSCLTTPSISAPQMRKHKKKPTGSTSLDEELSTAWAETKRKVLQKRGMIEGKKTASNTTPPRHHEEDNSNSSKENDEESVSRRRQQSISPTRSYASYKSSRSLRSQAFQSVRGNPTI